jgi:hypothetical protein
MEDNAKAATAAAAPQRKSFKESMKILRTLLPYLWPKGEWKLRIRVILAAALILASRGIEVLTPLLYAYIINSLPDSLPLHWLLAYGLSTLASNILGDIRSTVFLQVNQNVSLQLATKVCISRTRECAYAHMRASTHHETAELQSSSESFAPFPLEAQNRTNHAHR